MARAAMLLELGYLVTERAGGSERQRYLDLLVKVAALDARVSVSPELAEQPEAIRSQLLAEEREMLASLVIPVERSTAEIDLERWMESAARRGTLESPPFSASEARYRFLKVPAVKGHPSSSSVETVVESNGSSRLSSASAQRRVRVEGAVRCAIHFSLSR